MELHNLASHSEVLGHDQIYIYGLNTKRKINKLVDNFALKGNYLLAKQHWSGKAGLPGKCNYLV